MRLSLNTLEVELWPQATEDFLNSELLTHFNVKVNGCCLRQALELLLGVPWALRKHRYSLNRIFESSQKWFLYSRGESNRKSFISIKEKDISDLNRLTWLLTENISSYCKQSFLSPLQTSWLLYPYLKEPHLILNRIASVQCTLSNGRLFHRWCRNTFISIFQSSQGQKVKSYQQKYFFREVNKWCLAPQKCRDSGA